MAASTGAAAARRGVPATYRKPISSGDGYGPVKHRKMSTTEARYHADQLDRRSGPDGLDPDTINHPQIRQAAIDKFSDEAERDEQNRSVKGRARQAGRGANRVRGALNSAPQSVGAPSWGVPNITPDSGAGWLLGLYFYASIVNPYLTNGVPGIKAWWAAKWLNDTSAAQAAAATSPKTLKKLSQLLTGTSPTTTTTTPGSGKVVTSKPEGKGKAPEVAADPTDPQSILNGLLGITS